MKSGRPGGPPSSTPDCPYLWCNCRAGWIPADDADPGKFPGRTCDCSCHRDLEVVGLPE